MSEQAHADCKVQNWKIGRKTGKVGEKESKKGKKKEREKGEKTKKIREIKKKSERETFLPFLYALSRNFENYQRRQLHPGKGIRYHLIAKKKMTNAGL